MCWEDAEIEVIDHAVERVLGAVVVNGKLEAFPVTW
jgi:hypothetical protein